MVDLGEKGKNINDDIGSLVKKGLPIEVQQALNYCRVIGNNGVHPGEIELTSNPEISHSLFEMLNFIVEDRISRPKKVAALYNILPQGALSAVKKGTTRKVTTLNKALQRISASECGVRYKWDIENER